MKSRYDDERVHVVSPMTNRQAEAIGESVLEQLDPDALKQPTRLRLGAWMTKLEKYRIYTYPVEDAKFKNVTEGLTVPAPRGQIHILLPLSEYDAVIDERRDDSWTRRARASFLHELGHAIKHVPEMLRGLAMGEVGFNRVASRHVHPLENAEIQAFKLAACIAIPRKTLTMLPSFNLRRVCDTYGVNPTFARIHLQRLKLVPRPISSKPPHGVGLRKGKGGHR